MSNFFEESEREWTLADIYNDLCARADISKTLDVSPYRVAQWLVRREKIKCPYPIRRIAHIDIYSKQEWKDWFEQWTKKHRPKTKWTDDATVHGAGQPFFTYEHD